jgi:hypothetical protein
MEYFGKLLIMGWMFFIGMNVSAQQKIDPYKMNYIVSPKPNTILYNDTVYRGTNQFKVLFYRTHDNLLIYHYEKHQSNKIWGNVLGTAGMISTLTGVLALSSQHNSTGAKNTTGAWVATGSGLLCTIFGGYLLMEGQKHLFLAVDVFNQRYAKTKVTAKVGMSVNGPAMILNF